MDRIIGMDEVPENVPVVMNKMTAINIDSATPKGNTLHISFLDGARLEIHGNIHAKYHVTFIDSISDSLIYQLDINKETENMYWCETLFKYFIKWKISIEEDGVKLVDYIFNPTGEKVWIQFNSNALGDTVAWLPYVEEFRKFHQCEVHIGTFHNQLFESVYPNLHFHQAGVDNLEGYYAAYLIGVYDNNYTKNKNNWRTVPLQQVASDFLGLEYKEIKTKIVRSTNPRPLKEKYVALAEFSTFDCKEWLNIGGWQKIVNYLNGQGYKVVSVSREETKLNNVIKMNGKTIQETINNIQHAEFFIGVSSGCSWLAWGLNVPVIIISGPTLPFVEMKDCFRVINRNVCHGCMSDKDASFDRGNRRLCPNNKNLECSTSITPEMVIHAIDCCRNNTLYKMPEVKFDTNRILFITPHCSTGGLPEYLYSSVQDLRNSGCDVAVVEYMDIAPVYDVQKKKMKKICKFYTLTGDRHLQLKQIIEDFNPAVIHIEEFPEFFMPDETINMIYDSKRKYKIIETTHGMCVVPPEQKRYRPDRFIFVSLYHMEKFKDFGVPMSMGMYQAKPHIRPERSAALSKLGLDPTRWHVLNVGLFTPGKNQSEVFEVARLLPDIQFHFVGNQAGNFKQYWEPLIKNKPDNCIIWGERNDVDAFYAACDLFYFSSVFELFPIVLIEALSWKIPILMRDLETYCGYYQEDEPNIEFIKPDDTTNTIALKIRCKFPTLGNDLLYTYKTIKAPEPSPELIQIDSNNKKTTVAVVIPNYNYAKTLERTITSAQNQTIKPDKIIVVDGGSNDNSKEIAEKLGVTWIDNSSAGDAGTNKNVGITSSNCDFIVPLDADDWIGPTYIERCLEKMNNREVAVVTTQLRWNDGRIQYPDAPFTIERLYWRNRLFSCSMLRRSVIEQIGGYVVAPPQGIVNEDWDLWLRVVENGYKIAVVDEPLFHFTSRGPGERDTRYSLAHEAKFHAELKRRHQERMKEANSKINVVIFSKDRPLQLDALLNSIDKHAKWIKDLMIICKYSDEEYFKGYYLTAINHPKAKFINQDGTLKDALLKSIDINKQATIMLVDDDIFYRDLPIINYIKPGAVYSTRLGKNCTYCYTQDKAQEYGTLDFNYTWSLDGNIYNTGEILKHLKSLEYETPNQLENQLSKLEPLSMSHRDQSCLVGIPNNVVQSDYKNRNAGGDSKALNNIFLSGGRVDIDSMDFSSVRSVHQNIDYKIKPNDEPYKIQLKQILYEIPDPVIVELGACDGSDTYWLSDICKGNSKYIAVEPLEKHYEKICSLPNIIPINSAITFYTGTTTFYVSDKGDRSSSIHIPKEHLKYHPEIEFNKEITVPCITLDDLAKSNNLDKIDLLFVDIQGAEREMVLGGTEILKKTNWIFIESYTNEMYEGQIVREDLLKMLPDFELVGEFTDSNILLHRKEY
jgi:autotransporter strand-loop-strand O-heptosyltransferase